MDCWIDNKGVIYCNKELIRYPIESRETSYIVDIRCTAIGKSAFLGTSILNQLSFKMGSVSLINPHSHAQVLKMLICLKAC